MKILGLSAFHRDSAAALVVDGEVKAAAQEERFSKKALDSDLPLRAARACLAAAGVAPNELDRVAFYEKPLRRFERVLASRVRSFPRGSGLFAADMFLWLGDRMWIKSRLAQDIGVALDRVRFVEHHLSLASAAYYPSPYADAAVLIAGAEGEWATTSLSHGRERELELLSEVHHPHSLGLFLDALTQFLGFEPGRDAAKLEALATLGSPTHLDALREVVPEHGDGSFSLDLTRFRFLFDNKQLWGEGLEELLGKTRYPGEPLRVGDPDAHHADVAASVQALLEERVLGLAAAARERTGSDNLTFGGELARNRSLVTRLAQESGFTGVHVAADCGDAGAAHGAALYLAHHVEGLEEREPAPRLVLPGFLDMTGEPEEGVEFLHDPLPELVRRLMAGESVAWVHGDLELGADTPGGRMALALPRAGARQGLLGALQRSEPWLPCQVALPVESASDCLDIPGAASALLSSSRLRLPALNGLADDAPGAVDHDGFLLPWLVDRSSHPRLHALLTELAALGSCPALLATPFALRGSPIVRSEPDAVEAWKRSNLDALLVEDRLYSRRGAGRRA